MGAPIIEFHIYDEDDEGRGSRDSDLPQSRLPFPVLIAGEVAVLLLLIAGGLGWLPTHNHHIARAFVNAVLFVVGTELAVQARRTIR